MTDEAFSFRSLIKPGEGAVMTLRKALEYRRAREQDQMRFKRHRYQGMADLLLAHGTFFTGRELPDQWRDLRGQPNQCHPNSVRAALSTPELRYFTGVYMVGTKFQTHSWCVDSDGGVVELTLEDAKTCMERYGRMADSFGTPGRLDTRVPWMPPENWAYCGVEYDAEFANAHMETRGLPMLDPLVEESPGEIGMYLPTEELSMFKRQFDPKGFAFTEPDQDALTRHYRPPMFESDPGMDTCNVCGEERAAKIHTDTELHPDDAADGLTLHDFEPISDSPADLSEDWA